MPPLTDKAASFARTETEEGTVGQWQPIESAPKDGTEVDLWVKAGEFAFRAPDAQYRLYQSDREPEGWYDDGGDNLEDLNWSPLFWMPLPAPPSDAALGNPQVAE